MILAKKLASGTNIKAWNFEEGNCIGQTVGVKNSNGDYEPIMHIESANCDQGIVNRVVLKKSVLEKLGFLLIEE